jgi:hypothetical protein
MSGTGAGAGVGIRAGGAAAEAVSSAGLARVAGRGSGSLIGGGRGGSGRGWAGGVWPAESGPDAPEAAAVRAAEALAPVEMRQRLAPARAATQALPALGQAPRLRVAAARAEEAARPALAQAARTERRLARGRAEPVRLVPAPPVPPGAGQAAWAWAPGRAVRRRVQAGRPRTPFPPSLPARQAPGRDGGSLPAAARPPAHAPARTQPRPGGHTGQRRSGRRRDRSLSTN